MGGGSLWEGDLACDQGIPPMGGGIRPVGGFGLCTGEIQPVSGGDLACGWEVRPVGGGFGLCAGVFGLWAGGFKPQRAHLDIWREDITRGD